MTNIQALKPGKYAVLFRNNCDGEGDTYETLAILDEGLVWRDEYGDELFEFQGDAVLKAWPLDDGSNVLALLDELEAKDKRIAELSESHKKLHGVMSCAPALRRIFKCNVGFKCPNTYRYQV